MTGITLEKNPPEPIILMVEPEEGVNIVLDKTVSDLQTDVVIDPDTNIISGNLMDITGWTEYSAEPSEQDGNFLVLNISADPSDSTLVVELNDDVIDPVEVDSDPTDVFIFRIEDKDEDVITVTAYDSDPIDAVEEVYTLTGLTFFLPGPVIR